MYVSFLPVFPWSCTRLLNLRCELKVVILNIVIRRCSRDMTMNPWPSMRPRIRSPSFGRANTTASKNFHSPPSRYPLLALSSTTAHQQRTAARGERLRECVHRPKSLACYHVDDILDITVAPKSARSSSPRPPAPPFLGSPCPSVAGRRRRRAMACSLWDGVSDLGAGTNSMEE
jgi:hypothetical protein